MITIYTTPEGLINILDHKTPASWSFVKEGLNVCEIKVSEKIYRLLFQGNNPKTLLKD